MTVIDGLILNVIETGRRASATDLAAIIEHVTQAPFASYLSHVPSAVRSGLAQEGVILPSGKVRAVEWHLLKRIYLDQQWPVGTTEAAFIADLHQALANAQTKIWTYRYYSHPYAGFLSPFSMQQSAQPQRNIFVAYSPIFGTITTAYQTSDIDQVFDAMFSDIVQHKTMHNHLAKDAQSNNENPVKIALRGYASLIASASELADAWNTMEAEEQVLQRAFTMSEWSKRHELGAWYRANELSPSQVNELAHLDHALLEQAAAIEIAYGPSIWQLVGNLLDWGTPLSEERGSVQMAVPVWALPELAKHFAR